MGRTHDVICARVPPPTLAELEDAIRVQFPAIDVLSPTTTPDDRDRTWREGRRRTEQSILLARRHQDGSDIRAAILLSFEWNDRFSNLDWQLQSLREHLGYDDDYCKIAPEWRSRIERLIDAAQYCITFDFRSLSDLQGALRGEVIWFLDDWLVVNYDGILDDDQFGITDTLTHKVIWNP
jgi:hypothetical protein